MTTVSQHAKEGEWIRNGLQIINDMTSRQALLFALELPSSTKDSTFRLRQRARHRWLSGALTEQKLLDALDKAVSLA